MNRSQTSTIREATSPEIIWVFGSHNKVAERSVIRGLHGQSYIQKNFRNQLDISETGLIIPIWSESKHRFELAKKLAADEYPTRCVVLMVGQHEDLETEDISEFEGCRALLFHPMSRQFYIDTGLSTGYKQYTDNLDELREQLSELFDLDEE